MISELVLSLSKIKNFSLCFSNIIPLREIFFASLKVGGSRKVRKWVARFAKGVLGQCIELVEVFMGLGIYGFMRLWVYAFMGLWLNCVFQRLQGFQGFQGVALSLSKC